ncbi:MAG TPA: endo alpha-1,4 polygalactosaminidase, partial [bacterium]|nr:endo alpha-1,4 polygalactosaminidase [bacterium]
RDGSDDNPYTAADLAAIRAGRSAVRILAYFSIGEAENYRGYWQAFWDANDDGRPDPDAPAWLGPENPDWDGNYAVRYWDPAWQELILARLDRLVTAGYDGVYLDLVDAFEYWGPDGDQPAPRNTAARDMADFIARLAARARTRNAAFLIVPQNGEALGEYAEYRRLVNGIGREDVWYDGDDRQAGDETAGVLRALKRFQDDGKFVLTIDYPTTAGARAAYYAAAGAAGMLALAPPRALDRCVTRAGDDGA